METVIRIVLLVVVGGIYFAALLATAWGWIRLAVITYPRTPSSIMSLIGFTFATVSLMLAISSGIYAHEIHGFPFYDPLLMRIYRTGGCLSLVGIVFASIGVRKQNPLRWHAGVRAVGTFLFWCFSAMGEYRVVISQTALSS